MTQSLFSPTTSCISARSSRPGRCRTLGFTCVLLGGSEMPARVWGAFCYDDDAAGCSVRSQKASSQQHSEVSGLKNAQVGTHPSSKSCRCAVKAGIIRPTPVAFVHECRCACQDVEIERYQYADRSIWTARRVSGNVRN